MFRTETRRERRDLDRQQRRAAANRRIGHDMAWWYYWETPIKVATMATLTGVGGWLLWTRVDHRHIAAVVAGIGAVAFAVYLVRMFRSTSPRILALQIAGRPWLSPAAWHMIGVAGALLIVGGAALWRASA